MIRHGEAVCNVAGIIGGPRGCTGLSPLGVSQAVRLRGRLERTGELASASALVTSALPRAQQTASVIGPAVGDGSLVPAEDCDVCELHPGPEIDGLSWEEYSLRFGGGSGGPLGPDQPIGPGGESWSVFRSRVSAALDRLAEDFERQTVVVACHGGVVVAAMSHFLALPPPGERAGLEPDHTSLTEFARGAEGPWRLARYNDAAHLLDWRP
ncbi:MAG TPA: histidine phosphatase family protein [Acidimicrobiales bacterium]